jgi:hypothetical protein
METSAFWSAPTSVANLANSSWHIKQVGSHYVAGHFYLTGHGGALDARVNALPTGRTAGRALRAFRKKLGKSPIPF